MEKAITFSSPGYIPSTDTVCALFTLAYCILFIVSTQTGEFHWESTKLPGPFACALCFPGGESCLFVHFGVMCSGAILFSNEAPVAARVIHASGNITGRQQATHSFHRTAVLTPKRMKAEPHFIPPTLSQPPPLHPRQSSLYTGGPDALIFSNPENGPSLLIASVSTGSPQAQSMQGASPVPRGGPERKQPGSKSCRRHLITV